MCFTRLRDVELHDGYAKVWVTEHGKEGAKFLQCIDSYPYLLRWLEAHPFQHEPDAFLFYAGTDKDSPVLPATVNKHLRRSVQGTRDRERSDGLLTQAQRSDLRQEKGDSDLELQHRAGWTSTKQLQTYDLSTPEDAYSDQLAKRGLTNREREEVDMSTKSCVCGALAGFADRLCTACHRVLDGRDGPRPSRRGRDQEDARPRP